VNGHRILIVDDDPALVRLLRTNLVVRGYGVVTAETGEDALFGAAQH
jgi:two-component system, OmpR family, KDP operon response regulator KdpE